MAASLKYKLIIGLGNPGEEYKDTYHNAGLLFISRFYGQEVKFKTYKNFSWAKINDLIFVKAADGVFMNNSGIVAKEAIKYHSIPIKEVLIVHDDSDIELGKYKISYGGSSAGHKGVQSVIDHLGTGGFHRLRFGVRGLEENEKRLKAGDFVLREIRTKELLNLTKAFDEAEKEIISQPET